MEDCELAFYFLIKLSLCVTARRDCSRVKETPKWPHSTSTICLSAAGAFQFHMFAMPKPGPHR